MSASLVASAGAVVTPSGSSAATRRHAVGVDVTDDDVRPFGHEAPDDAEADARRSAGDQCDLPLETFAHGAESRSPLRVLVDRRGGPFPGRCGATRRRAPVGAGAHHDGSCSFTCSRRLSSDGGRPGSAATTKATTASPTPDSGRPATATSATPRWAPDARAPIGSGDTLLAAAHDHVAPSPVHHQSSVAPTHRRRPWGTNRRPSSGRARPGRPATASVPAVAPRRPRRCAPRRRRAARRRRRRRCRSR